jgi:hypothetical protein
MPKKYPARLHVRLLITQIIENFTAPNFVPSSGRIKMGRKKAKSISD